MLKTVQDLKSLQLLGLYLICLLILKCTNGLELDLVSKKHTDFKSHLKAFLVKKVLELRESDSLERFVELTTIITLLKLIMFKMKVLKSLKAKRFQVKELTLMLTGFLTNLLETGPNCRILVLVTLQLLDPSKFYLQESLTEPYLQTHSFLEKRRITFEHKLPGFLTAQLSVQKIFSDLLKMMLKKLKIMLPRTEI
jgi:hypothetical protein